MLVLGGAAVLVLRPVRLRASVVNVIPGVVLTLTSGASVEEEDEGGKLEVLGAEVELEELVFVLVDGSDVVGGCGIGIVDVAGACSRFHSAS